MPYIVSFMTKPNSWGSCEVCLSWKSYMSLEISKITCLRKDDLIKTTVTFAVDNYKELTNFLELNQ